MKVAKIKLGQVWSVPTIKGCQYKINRIEDKYVYATNINDGVECYFISLNESGYAEMPNAWVLEQDIQEQAPITKRSAVINDMSDWRAWKHNVPGECVCGIRKEDCFYHK